MLKRITILYSLVFALPSYALSLDHTRVIYGDDNRLDIIDSDNPLHVKLALSTAAQIDKNLIHLEGENAFLNYESLEVGEGVCSHERFAQQNSIARCSGFLVAKDLLVTAGHCLRSQEECDNYHWVFDYQEGEVIDNKLPSSSIYNCKKIVKQKLEFIGNGDYSIIQLDRKVKDRKPLKFRKKGEPQVGDELVVIGHPSGLPTKIAGNGKIVESNDEDFFITDLDAFGGNSGSAVFNASSGVVEGILVRGARDYIFDHIQGCYVTNVCEQVGGIDCEGEEATRITTIGLKKYTGIRGFFKRLFGKL